MGFNSAFKGLIFSLYLFSCFVHLFSILCILCFCIVSPFVYSRLFHIFVQVYRPLPPGGNPIAVNKYHIVSYILTLAEQNCWHCLTSEEVRTSDRCSDNLLSPYSVELYVTHTMHFLIFSISTNKCSQ